MKLLRGMESEGGSPHWGVRPLLRGGCEQICGGGAGAQADLERLLLTEAGASAGATGRGPRGFTLFLFLSQNSNIS